LEDLQKARVLRWISGQTERRMVHFRRRLSRTGGDACYSAEGEGERRFAGSLQGGIVDDLLAVSTWQYTVRRNLQEGPLVAVGYMCTRRVKMFSRLGGDGSGLAV
jgi:hypothetical protein